MKSKDITLLRRIKRDPTLLELKALIRKTMEKKMTSTEKIAEGAYGIVYKISFNEKPNQAIVKWQKRPGRGVLEKRQLYELGKYSKVNIPEVFYYHPESKDIPFEALIMEYIPGVPASQLKIPEEKVKTRFAKDIIDALMQWHSVSNRAGYGELDGPYYRSWLDFYRKRLEIYYKQVKKINRLKPALLPEVLKMAEISFELTEKILGNRKSNAVLVHSDFWLGNIMVDAKTYKITGIIDPLDAEWADREIDLIHLEHSWGGKLRLLESYKRQVPLDDAFPLRYAFYRFWYYVMQNFARIGWHNDKEDIKFARALEKAIREYL